MRFRLKAVFPAGLAALWLLGGAASADAAPLNIDPEMPLPKKLSEFNLFQDAQAQTPNEGLLPYDLSSPLFTDYAEKDRFVWMPAGTSAAYHETDVFAFPVGTVLVKTFSYPVDARDHSKGMRRLETRILWHRAKGWVALPYVWADDMSDARLAVAGARVPVDYITPQGETRHVDYVVPNMNQCKLCHENQKAIHPIGPKARYLNKDFAYPHGTANQLAAMVQAGYLKGVPEDPAALPEPIYWDKPESAPLTERARTYLDINCAHCHNPKGPAYTSGLDLTFHQSEPMRIGLYKPPVAAGRGSAGLKFGVVPGHPEESILLARMNSLDPGMMMAQVGRTMIHQEGVALISEWIAGLKPEDYAHLKEGAE